MPILAGRPTLDWTTAGHLLAQLSGGRLNAVDKFAHLEVCGHDSQFVVGGICPLISSSHLGCHACCVCLVLPLHCQQCVLPVLGLVQPPVQIQNVVLQLLHTRSILCLDIIPECLQPFCVLPDVHMCCSCAAPNKPVRRELASTHT